MVIFSNKYRKAVFFLKKHVIVLQWIKSDIRGPKVSQAQTICEDIRRAFMTLIGCDGNAKQMWC